MKTINKALDVAFNLYVKILILYYGYLNKNANQK